MFHTGFPHLALTIPSKTHWICLSFLLFTPNHRAQPRGTPRTLLGSWICVTQRAGQLPRGTQNSPRETPGSQCSHGKGAQALGGTGNWGSHHLWVTRNATCGIAGNGIDPSLDSMLWEVFSKLDDSGMLLAGLERAGVWIWAAQHGTAILCSQGSLQNKIGRMGIQHGVGN